MQQIRQIIFFAVTTCLMIIPVTVLAAQTGNVNDGTGGQTGGVNTGGNGGTGGGSTILQNPLGNTTLLGFFQDLLEAVMILAVPIIVFFIILAGFKYVTARGNVAQVEQAHKALLYAILGGVLILGAQAILIIIKGTVESFGS